jgi:hypothetical protein
VSAHSSAAVVPFGKHKGAAVAELVTKDPDYVRWLTGQGWLAQRFAELHAAIANPRRDQRRHAGAQRAAGPVPGASIRHAVISILLPDPMADVVAHATVKAKAKSMPSVPPVSVETSVTFENRGASTTPSLPDSASPSR